MEEIFKIRRLSSSQASSSILSSLSMHESVPRATIMKVKMIQFGYEIREMINFDDELDNNVGYVTFKEEEEKSSAGTEQATNEDEENDKPIWVKIVAPNAKVEKVN